MDDLNRPMNSAPAPALPLLRHRPFVRFLYARIAASIALQMNAVAVGWEMYALTENAFDLGLIGLTQFVPIFGLFLLTGHAADRYDRRTVTWMAQLCAAFGVATLALASAGGWLRPGLILAMVFFVGVGRAFEQPSLQSLLPNIVTPVLLPRAVAASTSASQTAIVAGPALGGLLIALSPTLVFAACALLWISSGFFIRGVAMRRAETAVRRAPVNLEMLFGGLAFMRRNPVVLGAIVLDLFVVLLGSATVLLPIFARDVFLTGPLVFGALRAAPAAGALLTALVLTRWPITRNVGRTMFLAVAAFGAGTILLALSPHVMLAMGAMGVVGAADTVSVVIRQTLVQIHTPDEMRGRVYAVNAMFTGTSNQLGDFRAGVAAAVLGAVPAVLIGGLTTLAVVAVSTRIFRELYRADTYEPVRAEAAGR
jgi:MFS family permease